MGNLCKVSHMIWDHYQLKKWLHYLCLANRNSALKRPKSSSKQNFLKAKAELVALDYPGSNLDLHWVQKTFHMCLRSTTVAQCQSMLSQHICFNKTGRKWLGRKLSSWRDKDPRFLLRDQWAKPWYVENAFPERRWETEPFTLASRALRVHHA